MSPNTNLVRRKNQTEFFEYEQNDSNETDFNIDFNYYLWLLYRVNKYNIDCIINENNEW